MVDFANWVLLFIEDGVEMLFSLTSVDGFPYGWMILAVAIMGTVISATIGAVSLVSQQIKDNSYARSAASSAKAGRKAMYDKLDKIDKGLNG